LTETDKRELQGQIGNYLIRPFTQPHAAATYWITDSPCSLCPLVCMSHVAAGRPTQGHIQARDEADTKDRQEVDCTHTKLGV